MLVLSRKKNESIIVDDNIEIVIVDISDDQVRLGIKAPRSVEIHRKEIYERIAKQMRKAAKSSSGKLTDGLSKKLP